MLYEIKGRCVECSSIVSVRGHASKILDCCPECGEVPFEINTYSGLVYVVKNKNQSGVKIGMTNKNIEDRLRTLNATGVPGGFDLVVMFASKNPKKDEKRVHERLKNKKIEKEHFDMDPVDAAIKCFRILNKPPIFTDPRVEEVFNLRIDANRAKMRLRLAGHKG